MHMIKRAIATLFTRRAFFRLLLLSPVFYVVTCSFIAYNGSVRFERIAIGDSKAAVLNVFGEPSHIEHPDILYSVYAYKKCPDPCVERLWYENRLSMVGEAWAFEIDKDNRVIYKGHWVSP